MKLLFFLACGVWLLGMRLLWSVLKKDNQRRTSATFAGVLFLSEVLTVGAGALAIWSAVIWP